MSVNPPNMSARLPAACLALLLTVLLTGCVSRPMRSVTLATTTSTQDSGLLDELLPLCRSATGVEVRVVAVGTGQALEIGRRGDADLLLVHDPASEERFMLDGFGESRTVVMRNAFVLVGPAADPAGAKGLRSAGEAFARLARKEIPFVSRGDESGTHQKEKAIWKEAGVVPQGGWYIRSGQGMGALLRMADQKDAYTLTDRATFFAHRKTLRSEILVEGDPTLVNCYSVIVVSPNRHPHVKRDLALQVVNFLKSEECQSLIARFGTDRHGEPLFARASGVSDHPRQEGP